jgi:hypothetical protein
MESEMRCNPLSALLLATALTSASAPAWSDVRSARYEYEKGNYAAALQQAKSLADAGDSDAQVLMAVMYTDGKALPQDDAQAADWYWKAANAGNSNAQLALSAVYADGRGVPKDDNLANYWKWQAAVANADIQKNQLEAEIVKQQKLVTGTLKYVPPVINQKDCKEPTYKRTGYGYHLSGEIQILFMIEANGKILEASLLQKSDWPAIDRSFLESFTKTCTFKPATNNELAVMGVYKLQTTWSVDP